MRSRFAAIVCLVAAGLMLGGCTKCGWFWNEWRACHADAPRSLAGD